VKSVLNGTFVVYTRRATAPGRSKGARYYGLVELRGRLLDEILISEGLARNKGTAVNLPDGTKSRVHIKKLEELEAGARRARRGAWATAQK
jgi:endonuclease YncB( thermonuclease family)